VTAARPRSAPARAKPARGDSMAQRLKSLGEIASLVNAGGDLDTILNRACYAVCHGGSWSTSSIMAVDREAGHSVLVTLFDPYTPTGKKLPRRWDLDTSPTLHVVEENRPVVIHEAQKSREFPGYREDARARGYHTAVLLPLRAEDGEGRPLVIAVHAREPYEVDELELSFLETVAHLAGIAVEKTRGMERERARSERLQRSMAAQAELMGRVLAESSLPHVVEMVGTLLGDAVLVADLGADFLVAGRSPAPEAVPDGAWPEFVRAKAGRMLLKAVRGAIASGERSIVLDFAVAGVDVRRPAVVESLEVDGQTVGGLVVFRDDGSADELDALAVDQAKFALSVQLMRGHIRFESENLSRADLLARVLDGTWRDREDMVARAGRLGLDLTGQARLVGVGFFTGEDTSGGFVHRALARVVGHAFPGSAVLPDGAEFLLFVPWQDDRGESRWMAALDRLKDEIAAVAGRQPALVASGLCRRLEDYAASRAEIVRGLALARSFRRTGVLSPRDFGPFAVLLSATDRTAVQQFTERTLGAIESYDAKHGTELLKTAAAFLESGCKYQASADALGIHVTTLRYRLERLRELFQLDFDDAERRFAIDLALRLGRLFKA
jgi:DNA-binding PucR family transcriptional regulator